MNLAPKLILGTAQFGMTYGINNSIGLPSQEDVFTILDMAAAAGIYRLDTADAYGLAINRIGNYHAQRADRFTIINKFSSEIGTDTLIDHFKINARILQIDSVDIYLFHNFVNYYNGKKLLGPLREAKEDGLIKNIGVSIYTNEEFEKVLEDSTIEVIQFPYNVLDNDFQRSEIIKKAKDKGVILNTRSTFLQGLFFKAFIDFPTILTPLIPYLKELATVAQKYNVSIGTLALKYVINNEHIDGVILGIESIDQLKDNLKFLEEEIDNEAFKEINNIHVGEHLLLYPNNW